MKQSITKEQWDELNENNQKLLLEWIMDKYNNFHYPNIGQMIEFLGDNLEYIEHEHDDGEWLVVHWYEEHLKHEKIYGEELIDALWEATKDELKPPLELN